MLTYEFSMTDASETADDQSPRQHCGRHHRHREVPQFLKADLTSGGLLATVSVVHRYGDRLRLHDLTGAVRTGDQ